MTVAVAVTAEKGEDLLVAHLLVVLVQAQVSVYGQVDVPADGHDEKQPGSSDEEWSALGVLKEKESRSWNQSRSQDQSQAQGHEGHVSGAWLEEGRKCMSEEEKKKEKEGRKKERRKKRRRGK